MVYKWDWLQNHKIWSDISFICTLLSETEKITRGEDIRKHRFIWMKPQLFRVKWTCYCVHCFSQWEGLSVRFFISLFLSACLLTDSSVFEIGSHYIARRILNWNSCFRFSHVRITGMFLISSYTYLDKYLVFIQWHLKRKEYEIKFAPI